MTGSIFMAIVILLADVTIAQIFNYRGCASAKTSPVMAASSGVSPQHKKLHGS